MPAPSWRHRSGLIWQLIERPQGFHFVQAIRILDQWLRREGGGQTLDSVLRCRNSVSLAFPPSEIEALTVEAGYPVGSAAALQARLSQRQLRHVRLTPAFMGFLGVNGVLPYCYTDAIAAQLHAGRDGSGRAFLDSFTHRPMLLFYRAWEKSRVEYRRDARGGDGFLPLQRALAGALARASDALPPAVAARYAALARQRPVSAAALATALHDYFAVPVALQPFVGGWEQLRTDEQSRLGVANCQLGVRAMVGQRYWRRDLCVRLRLGPLTRQQYDSFLPRGGARAALGAMLALFAVPTQRFELRLILRARDVHPAVLDGRSQLGRSAFMIAATAAQDRDDTYYHIAL